MYKKIPLIVFISCKYLFASDDNSIETQVRSHGFNQILAFSNNLNIEQLQQLIDTLQSKNTEENQFNYQRLYLQNIIVQETQHGPGFGQAWKEEENLLIRKKNWEWLD